MWRAIGVIVLLAVAASVSVAQTQEGQQAQSEGQTVDFERLNLNTASRDDFLTVPEVGNRMVREFMEYRPYVSIRQFRREIGKYVSDEQVAAYEQYHVGASTGEVLWGALRGVAPAMAPGGLAMAAVVAVAATWKPRERRGSPSAAGRRSLPG